MAATPSVILVQARGEHVPLIAEAMRPADAAEVLASGGYTPEGALWAALAISEMARTVFIAGAPLAMFGVVPIDEVWVAPWLLTTTVVDRFPLTFWRASKAVLARLREMYPFMVQQVDARYPQALNWARRLGFNVEPPEPFGRAELPFHRITIGAS